MSDKHQYLHLSSQKQPFLAFEDDDCLESEDNVQQALSPSPTMRRRFGSLAITVVNIAVLLCTILLVLWSRYYSSAAEIRNYHIRQTNNHCTSFSIFTRAQLCIANFHQRRCSTTSICL